MGSSVSVMSSIARICRPSSRTGMTFSSTARRAWASVSPAREGLSALSLALSATIRSARTSSVSMLSMSPAGSMAPVPSSKQRTMWQMASTCRICSRSMLSFFVSLPTGTPWMSTSRTVACTSLRPVMWAAMASSRGSGMWAMPTWAFSEKASAWLPVRALKSVVLPEAGRPTMPTSMVMSLPEEDERIAAPVPMPMVPAGADLRRVKCARPVRGARDRRFRRRPAARRRLPG